MVSARDTWLIQLRAQRAAADAITLLAQHGIDALPVKGVITSRTLYADVSERLLTDVDLKVRPEDFRRVVRVVRSEGFPILQLLHTYGTVVFSLDGVMIDVESHPAAPHLSSLSVDQMLRRSTPSNLLGAPHALPELYDHAVLLLLNVFKDKLGHAFKWSVRDVELLGTQVDPRQLAERLVEVGAASAGYVVACWLGERGHPAWCEIARSIVPRRRWAESHLEMLRGRTFDSLALRLHTRTAPDSIALRGAAVVAAGACAVEIALSQFGPRPHRRSHQASDVLSGLQISTKRDGSRTS